MTSFPYEIHATDGAARTGVLKTPRGEIRTPAFMPVGTAGTVKALYMDQVKGTGADIILGNTYHLMLRPGAERVKRLGGLHKFSTWQGPILTDSGGFQVWSLSKLRQMTEKGVKFRSHIDGSEHNLTPERSIEIQADLLGADISMQLDECTPFGCSEKEARQSMELSIRWGQRSKTAFGSRESQALFGIVQGSVFENLRRESAEKLIETGYDGYAIGGLAVGEGFEVMCEVLDFTTPHLPTERPRYLMGVGKPIDLVEAVARGVDMFDCVLPTRSGRHGQAWSDYGPINIKRAEFAEDERPLNPDINCPASTDYSRAYLHHLFRAGEYLSAMLLSWHNIAYFEDLTARMRAAIMAGEFETFRRDFRAKWEEGQAEAAERAG
ncbi:MAG: tRNA guanosine(34) transglycosylase Tgt [Alphaproteobacteria bacterium]|uniref:tRNA guanosine(34) transglycosylase Tgt n=1 Tax=Maricaulis alexandrii TaxID=2570354 RepID=UPI0011097F81|nr:tRNA guanosine(34) transglycosylase Tgt [Maricaulis alexandrii]MCR9266973.1 tRNA guanosine(34) transglycosylase Tgt [Alphaproteobacteria bacterium]